MTAPVLAMQWQAEKWEWYREAGRPSVGAACSAELRTWVLLFLGSLGWTLRSGPALELRSWTQIIMPRPSEVPDLVFLFLFPPILFLGFSFSHLFLFICSMCSMQINSII